ncbi:MAG TPA: hypothetical protein V6D47_19280, partial [Oscillatoriaceae cyanobacterium]
MKYTLPFWRSMGIAVLCTAIPACAPLPSVEHATSAFTIARQALLEHLAHPTAYDWQVGRLSTPEADRLREETPSSATRKLQALSSNWN